MNTFGFRTPLEAAGREFEGAVPCGMENIGSQ
jgi:hypothetical protein